MRSASSLRPWLFVGLACVFLLILEAPGQPPGPRRGRNWPSPPADQSAAPPKPAVPPWTPRPVAEILSGQALNAASKAIQNQWRQGTRGPRINLDESVAAALNVTPRAGRGDASLIVRKGLLVWPVVLQGEAHAADRKQVEQDLARAAKQARSGTVDSTVTVDLRDTLSQMSSRLEQQLTDDQSGELTPARYIEARRFLKRLQDTEAALEEKDLRGYIEAAAAMRDHGGSVAELVRYLDEHRLRIAPAWPGDEPAYLKLNEALMNYLRQAEEHRDK